MIKEVKQLRVDIDGLSQLVKELKPINESSSFRNRHEQHLKGWVNSKEINKCYDSLILAKAWLGKVLGTLGEETPYANDGKRKDIKDIEPTADVQTNFSNDAGGKDINTLSHIEKVDWLREEITKLINTLFGIYENFDVIYSKEMMEKKGYSPVIELEVNNILTHLQEARFQLGFELSRIKREQS